MKRLNQSGSHVLAIALLIAVLGVVGFAGYKVMNANKDTNTTASAPIVKTSSTAPSSIQNTADLTQAARALDSSTSQVNSGLDDSQLNGSLNDML